jgi:predicted transcriptional regulator
MRLKSYLESRSKSVGDFAKENDIPVMTVTRVVQGRWVSLRTADRIVRATGGKVRLEDLIPVRSDGKAA